jgi:hypothetical protein
MGGLEQNVVEGQGFADHGSWHATSPVRSRSRRYIAP